VKLDRAELIRLIEARPFEGFWKMNPGSEWFPIALGSGIAIVVIVSMGLNANVMVAAGKTRDLYWLFGGVVFGGLIAGIGIFNLTRRKRYEALMAKYKEEIRAEDLVEALHFTNRWKAGMAIAEELYLPQKDFGFGMVWLACQCGNRRFAESFRVLVGMEDGREVLENIRLAEKRTSTFGCVPTIFLFANAFSLDDQLTQLIWKNPIDQRTYQYAVPAAFLIVFFCCGAFSVWNQWRLRSELKSSQPVLQQLAVEELKVLVGLGRLGRIAKAVLEGR